MLPRATSLLILPLVCALAAATAVAQTTRPPASPRTARSGPSDKPSSPAGFAAIEKDAAAARDAGNLDKALDLYKKGLALRPDWEEGLFGLGTAAYDLERYADASDAFRRLLTKDASSGLVWVLKGLSSFKLRNYDDALSELLQARERGVTASKDIAEAARYHTAILRTRIEEYEQALAILGDFGVEGNDSPRIVEAMGLATLRMPMLPDDLPGTRRELVMLAGRATYFQYARQVTAAKNAFEALTSRYPDTPNVHYAYGVMLVGEEPDLAIERFKRELRVSPTHALAKIQIAVAHIKRSEFAEAKPWAEQAVKEAPDQFVAYNALGQAQLALGEVEAAIASLETAVRLAPDSPSMHFSLARAYRAAKRTADADRAQAEFTRLDRLVRQRRTGENSVGGVAPPKNDR
jgi:tetratricopeptide (TPR) repeat protein